MADDEQLPTPPMPDRAGQGPGRPGPGSGTASGPPAGQARSRQLIADLAQLRRQARTARHAYWFPLIVFGLLTCGAIPIYVAAAAPPASGAYVIPPGHLILLGGSPGIIESYLGWYWAAALMAGYLLTLLWYRRHARRAGLRTPARGYLVTGVLLTVLVVAIPPLTRVMPILARLWLPFGVLWTRGLLAFLIIAAGLWVLAWAERSRWLAVIAAVYTGAALLASLYNVENILYRLGWNPGASAFGWQLSSALPSLLLPAAVLLVTGTAAFFAQRRVWPAAAGQGAGPGGQSERPA